MQLTDDAHGGRIRPDIKDIAREHYEVVFRFCARRVGPDRAADIAQETFLTAQRALSGYRGDSSVRTWLLGIANNEIRRATRQRTTVGLSLDYAISVSSDPGSEAALVNREILRQGLLSLSSEHREVVLMHELDGLTYEEIGDVLAIPTGTVKSRLHHAFQNLRKCLVDQEAK